MAGRSLMTVKDADPGTASIPCDEEPASELAPVGVSSTPLPPQAVEQIERASKDGGSKRMGRLA